MANSLKQVSVKFVSLLLCIVGQWISIYVFTFVWFYFAVRINDTVTFVEDGLDEDIEFGDEISTDGEGDPVDNVSIILLHVLTLF